MENEIIIRYKSEIEEIEYNLDICTNGDMKAKAGISSSVREKSKKLPILYVSDLAFRLSEGIDCIERDNAIMRIDYDNPVEDIFSGPIADYEPDEIGDIIVYRDDGMTQSLIELAELFYEKLQEAKEDLGFEFIAYESGVEVKIKAERAMEASKLEEIRAEREEVWEEITSAIGEYLSKGAQSYSIISITYDGHRRIVGFYDVVPVGLDILDEELRNLCCTATKYVSPKGLLPVTLEK